MMTVLPEAKVLDEIVSTTVKTSLSENDKPENIDGRTFFIQNNSAVAVYFKEYNGVNASTTNAIKVSAGATSNLFIASKLSIIASGEDDVTVLIVYVK